MLMVPVNQLPKKCLRRIVIAFQTVLLLAMAACSSHTPLPTLGVKDALQMEGFTVQAGKLALFDLVPYCCSPNPKVSSCYGNNANAPYLVAYLPNAPGQSPGVVNTMYNPATGLAPSYRLGEDEAVVLAGSTPPQSAYFSYTPYLMIRTLKNAQDESVRTRIFDSLTDSFNTVRIKTAGTPAGRLGNPFAQRFVVIYAADSAIAERARTGMIKAGYPEEIININPLPSQLLNMGHEQDSDELNIVNRVALPFNQAEMDSYLAAPNTAVYRLTPQKPVPTTPFPVSALISRKTGISETAAVTDVDLNKALGQLRDTILSTHKGYIATELTTGLWLYDGRQCMEMDLDCLGDSRDTTYLRSPAGAKDITIGPPYFTLDKDEFVIVYGVNHAATYKTTYSSFGLYAAERMLGIKGVTSETYANSSADYLKDPRAAHYLYAWKIARTCGEKEEHCIEIPASDCSTGAVGASLTSNLLIAFRNYQNLTTGVGPALDEILPDRVIHFRPRK
jgi:hypothetical protein